ncbi:hypothetical protein BK133_07075 [Paenibacillus sp. FSL H8-0548]|nr:hypothetical protein BK133_07075 [Paenibacillus sp. FSL H8-0548]
MPLFVGMLLLAALLLIPFSRNTNTENISNPDGKLNVQPAIGKLVIDQPSDIYVNVSLPGSQFETLQKLNQQFMIKYPHIQVKLSNDSPKSKSYEMWETQSQQGEASDIMLLDNGWVKPFAVRGFLKPMDSIMTGDILSDQMAGLLDSLKWNGYLWGVPRDVNPYVVVWSGALLEEAGLKEAPSEWASFQQAAEKVIELHPQASIINWSAGDLEQQLVWLDTFHKGLAQVRKVMPLDEYQLSQLDWMHLMMPHISSIAVDAISQLNEAFQGNKLFAAIIPWTEFERLNENLQSKLVVDRDQIVYPWLNGHSFVISSNSNVEEEAMLWIQEMTDVSSQQLMYTETGALPTRASIYSYNSMLSGEQEKIPPPWWEKVLNSKRADTELPSPDPQWPRKWGYRENMWRLYSEDAFQIDAYAASLTAASGE